MKKPVYKLGNLRIYLYVFAQLPFSETNLHLAFESQFNVHKVRTNSCCGFEGDGRLMKPFKIETFWIQITQRSCRKSLLKWLFESEI